MTFLGKSPFVCLSLLLFLLPSLGAAESLRFAGYDWLVTDSKGQPQTPGPSIFSPNNSYVDEEGKLHLKLIRGEDDVWTAGQVKLTKVLGYGKYQFLFEQDMHHFGTHDTRGDPHVIFGMWLYNNPQQLVQLDFARWGETGNNSPNGDNCVNPFTDPKWLNCRGFIQIINYNRTLHTIEWQKDRLYFQSFHLEVDNYGIYHDWEVESDIEIPGAEGMELYINLFFLRGRPHNELPLQEDLDVTLSSFTFTPFEEEGEEERD